MGQFYSERPEVVLRLGDVVTGFHVTTPQTRKSATTLAEQSHLTIAVERPKYLVVMTPCCSIEKGAIILAPLSKIHAKFLDNPHLEQDLTRINRKLSPRDKIPPQAWGHLTPAEEAKRLSDGPGYIFFDCFVYAPHDRLRPYELDRREGKKRVAHYMVEFKRLYRFESSRINRDIPLEDGFKLLQLTVSARQDLREKLAHYFFRAPQEDLVELEA